MHLKEELRHNLKTHNFRANLLEITPNFRAPPNTKILPWPSKIGPQNIWRIPSADKFCMHHYFRGRRNRTLSEQNLRIDLGETFEKL